MSLKPFAAAGASLALLGALIGNWASLRGQTPAARAVAPNATVAARQLEIDRGAAAVWQGLKKLHTRASVLLITAHPDDEDSGMLTSVSRGLGARAAMLTLNRGEGGQNVMSNDFYDALGLLRTQELLGGDRYFGVQQYFTRVIDFGFSKTQQETLEKWGHERVLADVVRVVRTDRPLVIASVFTGSPADGHGNHAVAGEMAQEVYNAAGDPTQFPDQIAAGLRPWNPLKMYAGAPFAAVTARGLYDSATGTYGPGHFRDYIHQTWIEGNPSVTVDVAEGGYDPMLGATYRQIASQGLGQQLTQNGGTGIPDPGPASRAYHRYASRVPAGDHENSYFDGIDTSLNGIATLAGGGDAAFLRAGLAHINSLVEQASAEFRAPAPDTIAPLLAQGLLATRALIVQVNASGLSAAGKADVNYELGIKATQFNDTLAQALALSLSATVGGGGGGRGGATASSFQIAIPGQRFDVQVHVADSSPQAVELGPVELRGPAGEEWRFSAAAGGPRGGGRGGRGAVAVATPAAAPPIGALGANQARDLRVQVDVPADAHSTRPYFSRPNDEQPYYDIDDPRYVTLPETPYPLSAWASFTYEGATISLGQVVQSAEKVNGLGTVENPLVVAPAIGVAISPPIGVVPLTAKSLQLTVTVHNNVKGAAQGTLRLRLPAGWTATPATATFALGRDGEDQPVSFQLRPSRLATAAYTVTAEAEFEGRTYAQGYRVVGYPGIRPSYLYSPATYRTRGVDVKVAPGLNLAYVTGSGDDVPRDLENLGIHFHFLSAQDLATADLSAYDAIVLGIRAYAARPELRSDNGRLLEYVRGGGVLIVQFETSEYDRNYGPYPLSLGGNGERVVDETTPVRILVPTATLLNWPNTITTADFDGWVEERGHGFMASWDPQYQALLETHDPGQPAQAGGLLVAQYGKGHYVYAGLAFYRQLADGVPGGFRLFANLLSLRRAPQTLPGR